LPTHISFKQTNSDSGKFLFAAVVTSAVIIYQLGERFVKYLSGSLKLQNHFLPPKNFDTSQNKLPGNSKFQH